MSISHSFSFVLILQEMTYSLPLSCNPRDPISFSLPIRFQQVSDPVPAQFTLSAQFLLLSERELWLTEDKKTLVNANLDTAFSKGKADGCSQVRSHLQM